MSTAEEIFKLIPISKDGNNLLIINEYTCTPRDARELASMLKEQNANFLGILMVQGPPNEAVSAISVNDLRGKK